MISSTLHSLLRTDIMSWRLFFLCFF